MEFFLLFLRNINISTCNEEKKSSPASYYQHSLSVPSHQTKTYYTLQSYQISVVAVSQRWALHYLHLVCGVSFSSDTWGNEGPTIKGLRRLQVPREAAGKPGNPHSGDNLTTHPRQVFLAQTNLLLQTC